MSNYGQQLLSSIERRLGGAAFASPGEVAAACNVSERLVRTWIEAGAVEAVNVAARPAGRARWRVAAPSVLGLYRKRLGLEPGKEMRR